jgi:uncharacterized C2H2 Zn-finger protein
VLRQSGNVSDEPVSVTTWPEKILPLPELERYPDAELDGDFLYLGHRWELAQAPHELHLRQARKLDPTNPGPAALDVARNVGGVGFVDENTLGPARDLVHPDWGARDRFAARRGRRYEPIGIDPARGLKVHVDEIAYRLRVLDILGRHVVAHRRNDYLMPVWAEALDGPPPRTERECWESFLAHMNAALGVSHARVLVRYGDGHNPGEEDPTFLEAGALGIVNELIRHAEYLTCPNCGTIFTQQVGGSTHFSRSTGVTYCTPKCATNARVRAYRARKRAERTSL